ncbi:hypothetical protein VNO80_10893 [Phaseolus coccineus]|uniref:Uncharacterized protein n=1 Tax=Phaseolus coccineus TaxID=3886 RepID=A0AAN9NAL7_PHACN
MFLKHLFASIKWHYKMLHFKYKEEQLEVCVEVVANDVLKLGKRNSKTKSPTRWNNNQNDTTLCSFKVQAM